MAYADRLLADGERSSMREHQHWFVLIAGRGAAAIFAVVIALVLLVLDRRQPMGFAP